MATITAAGVRGGSRMGAGGHAERRVPASRRGGRGRHHAGRPARDAYADRGTAGEGVAGASQPRGVARSIGGGTRGARRGGHAEAVFAQRRKLDNQVERRADLLSEPREHAFVKVRPRSDGSLDLLQLSLHPQRCLKPGARLGAGRVAGMAEEFRHRLRVRFDECDPQGVVFYANYLVYFDVGMTELWRTAFGSYAGLIESGIDAMVAEVSVRYRGSARFDDEIDLVATVLRIGNTSSVTAMRVERAADGATLVEGELRHVFVDVASHEKVELPEHVRDGLTRFADTADPEPGRLAS
jgi:acyl-CoA thioester hydrolase